MRNLPRKLSVARGEEPAALLFKNAQLVNVLSGEVHPANVAVDDGRVIGLGDYEAHQVVDLEGRYLAPSFIDGHFHVESTLLTIPEFVRAVAPHGTGAMVIDPHEFANVLGLDGIRYALESSRNLPIDFFIMLPSCVPATPLETGGARLTANDLRLMIHDERVAGVAELMNYPGVYLGWDSELEKIEAGKGKAIDGHAPGLRGKNLNAYVLAGVRSDHESTALEEAREKLRLGMHVLLREGSTERNLEHLLPLVTPLNAVNCSFATDDKLPGDLVAEGHIDHCVRKAIGLGVPAVTAIQMATINTARHYRLRNFGAVAPRYWADFVVFDDLGNLQVQQTWKRGALIAENTKFLAPLPPPAPVPRSTMNVRYSRERIEVQLGQKEAAVPPVLETTAGDVAARAGPTSSALLKVIEIVPQQIVTRQTLARPRIERERVVADPTRDILKLVVVERHRATGNVGVGFVRGFELQRGALGSTVAHDAHNIVVVGASDDDIVAAIRALETLQGGQVVVADGQVQAALGLPIAGLVSDQPLEAVIQCVARLNKAAAALGCKLEAPFMTLSFLSLSPIPELKLTDLGLIDAVQMRVTPLFAATA